MNWFGTILDGFAMAPILTYLPLPWRCITPG